MIRFELGHLDLTLAEMQSGFVAFGPQAANAVLKPLTSQVLRKLKNKRQKDPNDPFQKPGGLFVDLDGSLTSWLVREIESVGRTQDLILVELDGRERYNLLQPDMSVEENAQKLYQMVSSLEGGTVGLYRFVDVGFKLFLEELGHVLAMVRPGASLQNYAEALSPDTMAGWLEEATQMTAARMSAGEINPLAYQTTLHAANSVKEAFFLAVTKAQVMTRHALSLVSGWIPQNPETYRIFCTDSTFSMRDVIDEGKLIIFNGTGIEIDDARRVGMILISDLQCYLGRRAKPGGELNTARAALLVCPNYELVAPSGAAEGLDTRAIVKFWREANLNRTMAFLGCSEYDAFKSAAGDPNFENELRKAIRWWIILASESKAAADLVEFLGLASVETKSRGLGGTFRTMLKGASAEFAATEFAKLAGKARSSSVPAAIYDAGFGLEPRPRCLRMNLPAMR